MFAWNAQILMEYIWQKLFSSVYKLLLWQSIAINTQIIFRISWQNVQFIYFFPYLKCMFCWKWSHPFVEISGLNWSRHRAHLLPLSPINDWWSETASEWDWLTHWYFPIDDSVLYHRWVGLCDPGEGVGVAHLTKDVALEDCCFRDTWK